MQIIDKLISFEICEAFIDPVDPVKQGAPDYYEKIKHPMALSNVRDNLKSRAYQTVEEFQSDVNLIWSNAREYNGDDNLITHVALEAKNWFEKQMKQFPSTPEEEWLRKMQKISKEFQNAINHPPADLYPATITTPDETKSHQETTEEAELSEEKNHSSSLEQ